MTQFCVTEELLRRRPENLSEFNALNRVIEKYSESVEGLEFFLNGLVQFQSLEASDRAVSVLRQWLLTRFHCIPESCYQALKETLFHTVCESPRYIDDAGYQLAITDLRSFLVLDLYPENWPGFWNELPNLLGENVAYFLHAFTNTINQAKAPMERINRVLAAMMADGSQASLFLAVFRKSIEEPTGGSALQLLSEMAKWIDLSFLLTDEVLSFLISKIPNDCLFAMKTITNIFSRPLEANLLLELLERGSIHELIMGNVKSFSISELRECARFLQTVVYRIVDNPYVLNFVPVLLYLLAIPDAYIFANLKPLAGVLMNRWPTIEKGHLVATLISTISQALSAPNESTCIILDRASRILASVMFEIRLGDLLSMLSRSESIAEAAAVLVAMRAMVCEGLSTNDVDIGSFVSIFQALSTNTEMTQASITAIASFSVIIRNRLHETSTDFVNSLFQGCSKCLLCSTELDSDLIVDLEQTVIALSDNFAFALTSVQDLPLILDFFCTSERMGLVRVSSKIIACMDVESRNAIYPRLLASLQEHKPQLLLKFMKFMNLSGCDEAILHQAMAILNMMKEAAKNSGWLRKKFVKVCIGLMGCSSVQFIAEILPKQPGPYLLRALAQATESFKSNTSDCGLEAFAEYLLSNVKFPSSRPREFMLDGEERYSSAADALITFVISLFDRFSPDLQKRACVFLAECLYHYPELNSFNAMMTFIAEDMPNEFVLIFLRHLKPYLSQVLSELSHHRANLRRRQLAEVINMLGNIYNEETHSYIVSILPESCSNEFVGLFFAVIQGSQSPSKLDELIRCAQET